MDDETRELILKAIVIGSIAFTGYQLLRYANSEHRLMVECAIAREAYIGAADQLAISLEHILIEQIA